jgi:uncharacterized protein
LEAIQQIYQVRNQTLILLTERAIYWKEKKILIISDIHLGKANHFQAAGIPVNHKIHQKDLEVINELIIKYDPEGILILGDLFHSKESCNWEEVETFFRNTNIKVIFIKGNHDFLPTKAYHQDVLEIIDQEFIMEPFIFTHTPLKEPIQQLYNLAGHIHPGIQIKGKGRQNIVLPCFHFGVEIGILPAFGSFTGLYKIQATKKDQIFAITKEKIIALNC